MNFAANGMTALAFLGAALPVYILYGKRDEPGALYMLALCLALVIYSFNLLLFGDQTAVLLRFSVVSQVAPLYFLSVFAYLRSANRYWLAMRPGIYVYMALMLAAPWLAGDLFIDFADHQPRAAIREYVYEHGPIAWIMKLASYAFVLVAGAAVVARFSASRSNRVHVACLAIFPLCTIVFDLLAVLLGFSTYHGITVMQISATCTLFILSYALTRHEMLVHVPVSRNTLMKYLREGVCVIGEQGEIADCNETFASMISVSSDKLLGSSARHVLPEALLTRLDAHRRQETVRDAEVAMLDDRQYLSISVSALEDGGSLLLSCTDVTESKLLMEKVENTANELKGVNHRLEEMSHTDPLTGMGNRRKLQQALQRASLAGSQGSEGLLMIDVDHFKKVNDMHGHDVGDKVLIELAQAMRKVFRADDVLVRWGGEEFVAFLPNTNEHSLLMVAERLRMHISQMPIRLPSGGVLKVTASIGACMIRPSQSHESALRHVDKLLYEAKQNGRDCVKISRALAA